MCDLGVDFGSVAGRMTTNLFPKVHTSLTALLNIQRSGSSLENGLIVLDRILKEGFSDADQSEWSAVCSATAVAIRVLADQSTRSGEFANVGEYYASILEFIFKNPEVHLTLKWEEHYRPIFGILLFDVSGTNHRVTVLIKAVLTLFLYIKDKPHLSSEFFGPTSIPLFGKLIFDCIDIVSNEDRSTESRNAACEILLQLCFQKEVAPSLSVVLPGLTSRLSQYLCNSTCTIVDLVKNLLEVVFSTIAVCLKDDAYDEEGTASPSSLAISRTLTWGQTTAEKLVPIVTNLCARMSQHRDDLVRLTLSRGLRMLHTMCTQAFQSTLRATTLDTLFLLVVDDQKKIANESSDFLTILKNNFPSETFNKINERIVEVSESLPSAVRVKADPDPALRQLLSMCIALGYTSFASSSPLFERVLRNLAIVVRVDLNRLSLCLTEVSNVHDLVLSMPLKFGVEMNIIRRICEQLASGFGTTILEMLSEELGNCDRSDRTSFLFLSCLVVEHLPEIDEQTPLLHLAEICSEELSRLPLGVVPSDSAIKDLSEEVSFTTALAIGLLSCMTSCSKRTSTGANKILLKSVYSILQLCESSNWVLSSVADIALRDLSKSTGNNLSYFLMSHSSYVLSSIALSTRSAEAHLHAPRAFEAFLDRVDDPCAFSAVVHVVSNLVTALDIHQQQWTWVVLHALRSFLVAMNRWFPEMKPRIPEEEEAPQDEEDFGETKEVIPKEITAVEKVLLRTKHLLSSDHFPVLVVVMDTLRHGLHFLRFFENTLLPLIHQNWLALINRFKDSNPECRRSTFLVMVEMAAVSKAFVYRRIRFEAWPLLSNFLEKNVLKKSALPQSAIFKLCETILSKISDVFVDIELKEEDWNSIRPTLLLFVCDDVHPCLKAAAERAISTGDATFRV